MRTSPFILAGALAGAFVVCAVPKLNAPGLECHEAQEAAEAAVFLSRREEPKKLAILDDFHWAFGRLPWMHMYHMGAVKTYAMAAAFSVFGIGPVVVRSVTVAFGAMAVFFTVLLAARLYGTGWAAALGLWLATDPALLILSRHDLSAVPSLGLKMAGLWLLLSGFDRGSRLRLLAGGFALGLCAWEKLDFVWFLAGCAAALLLCAPAWRRSWRKTLIPAAAGLLLGTAPLIVFNVVYPLRTFRAQEQANAVQHHEEAALLSGLPVRAGIVGRGLVGVVTAAAPIEEVAGAYPGRTVLAAARFIPLLAAAAILLGLGLRRGEPPGRGTIFWTSATLACVAAACLTPAPIRSYHMPTFYPLAHLAVLACLAESAAGWGSRKGEVRSALGILLALSVAGNLAVLAGFYRRLADAGGYGRWYAGVKKIAELCREGGVVAPYEFSAPLIVYSGGRNFPRIGAKPLNAGASADSSMRIVTYDWPEPGSPPPSSQPPSALEGRRVLSVEKIAYSDASPWASVYTVQAPAASAAKLPASRPQDALLKEAETRARGGNPVLARNLLARAESLSLSDDDLARVADIYRNLKDDARALEILAGLTRKAKAGPALWLAQAQAAASAGRRELALSSLQKAEALGPDAQTRGRLAEVCAALGDDPRSEAVLESLTRRAPADAGLWIARAEAAARAGKLDQERSSLQAAENLKPTAEQSHRLALAYQALKDYAKAAGILERLTREQPQSAAYLADKGINEYLSGSRDAAVRDLESAIRLRPRSLSAYISLATIDAAQGRTAEALSVYDAALAVKPEAGQDALRDQIVQGRKALLSAGRPK